MLSASNFIRSLVPLMIVWTSISVAGGSTSARKPLASDAPPRSLTCEVIVNVPQKAIAIEGHVSSSSLRSPVHGPGWGWGLLASLFDAGVSASRDAEAEEAIVPIRATLANEAIPDRFRKSLEVNLGDLPCQAIPPVQLAKAEDPSDVERMLRASNGKQLLFINVFYSMSPDSRYLTANAFAVLVGESARGKVDFSDARSLWKEATYANRFTYTRKLDQFGDTKALTKTWVADDGRKLKSGLDELAEGIATLLVLDVSGRQPVSLPGENAERYEPIVGRRQVEAQRDSDGRLVVIVGDQ
jgi:hypothetical protein